MYCDRKTKYFFRMCEPLKLLPALRMHFGSCLFQSKEGKSPLHMAAIHGRFTRSQILIQNG